MVKCLPAGRQGLIVNHSIMSSNNLFMIQNFFKKSDAFMIGIPRNGSSTSRSSSPVMMQEALAVAANSRNLLSLGSRQSVTQLQLKPL